MIQYTLPEDITVDSKVIPIRSDYRAILDICVAMQDPDLTDRAKAYVAFKIFYVEPISFSEEALNYIFWFINCGKVDDGNKTKQAVKLFDWEQDFPLIVAPINRLIGCDIRGLKYLHWWTFMAYFQEIGECLFSRVISIRSKRARGKKLDDMEKEFYKENKELIDFKVRKLQPSVLLQRLLVQGGGD